ncbi:MAG TPA: hypothetical protein PLK30_07205 [Blastocatellia bacterium]|nr:hypothetical protein [Blastocatellia bacterium]
MTCSNNPNNHSKSEEDFDRFLCDVDDLYGDAPGLAVPPHFVARVTARAKAESAFIAERRSIWNSFWDFSVPVRVAAVSALLLASFGGIRTGLVITDLVTSKRKPEPAIQMEMDMAPAEQSLVQLVHSEGAAVAGNSVHKSGAAQ